MGRKTLAAIRATDLELRRRHTPMTIAPSAHLTAARAATKCYGDSWTCYSSSEALLQATPASVPSLVLGSVGKNCWDWGESGPKDYHYFLVDDLRAPALLADPTFFANFLGHDDFGTFLASGRSPLAELEQSVIAAGVALADPEGARALFAAIVDQRGEGALVVRGKRPIRIYTATLEARSRFVHSPRRIRAGAPR